MAKSKQSRKYQSIKKGKKGTTGLAVIILAAVAILAFGCIAVLGMTDYAVAKVQESSGVTLQVSLHGNDVSITILGGERADELDYLCIEIIGNDIPVSKTGKAVEKGQREVYFPSLAEGINGKHVVGISGSFGDGKTVLLLGKQINFA